MTGQKVLLLGATGETGGDILNGLVEDGSFVSIFNCKHSCYIFNRERAFVANIFRTLHVLFAQTRGINPQLRN
jgi:uncharacterized protein YbjT (DUF2867 family)